MLVCPRHPEIKKKITNIEEYRVVIKPAKIIPLPEETVSMVFPRVRKKCPVCGFGTAHYWLAPTMREEEPATRVYRCCKCIHSWRESQ